MKPFVRISLVGIVSMGVGGILGWQAFSYKIRLRAVPFDREQHHHSCIELAQYAPTIDVNFSPDGNTFDGLGQRAGTVEEDLDSRLARVAYFSTSSCIVVSFNSGVTVQQVMDMDGRIRSFGFPAPKMLIEDNRDAQTEEEERLFHEIRISPTNSFYGHNVEWYIDGMQQEATIRMKTQREHKPPPDTQLKRIQRRHLLCVAAPLVFGLLAGPLLVHLITLFLFMGDASWKRSFVCSAVITVSFLLGLCADLLLYFCITDTIPLTVASYGVSLAIAILANIWIQGLSFPKAMFLSGAIWGVLLGVVKLTDAIL